MCLCVYEEMVSVTILIDTQDISASDLVFDLVRLIRSYCQSEKILFRETLYFVLYHIYIYIYIYNIHVI